MKSSDMGREHGRLKRPRYPRSVGRVAGISLLLGLGFVSPVTAQHVRFRPNPRSSIQRDLARFLATKDYTIWSRDTILSRSDVVEGHVLVLEASVRIGGAVRGDIYVVDGDLFLRPGAHITGGVTVLGGGFYSSGMAVVDGRINYRPSEPLHVVPEGGGYLVYSVEEPLKTVHLAGLYGFKMPTYQRVDGWTLALGGRVRGTRVAGRPELRAGIRLKTDRADFEGSGRQTWHPRKQIRVGVEGGRETRTNDAWIRRNFSNTTSFLFTGDDYRNYYRADYADAFFEIGKRQGWNFRFAAGWEEAKSLVAKNRTILFDDDVVRPNPAVDDGDIYSLNAVVDFEHRRGPVWRRLHLHLEGANDDAAGDFSFLMGEGHLFVRQPVIWGHSIELQAISRGDLAGDLPRQRWSAIGGVGTLPTFPILGLRGERMFLSEITWLVPVPLLSFPQLGPTEVLVRGTIGSAWSKGEPLQAEQNVMLGIRILFFEAALAADPGTSDGDLKLFVTGRWPHSLRGS